MLRLLLLSTLASTVTPKVTLAPPALEALSADLVRRHGSSERARVGRGVAQVAALWRPDDGDLATFVRSSFLPTGKALDDTLDRFEANFEQIDGHCIDLARVLRQPTELDLGPPLPIDGAFAAWEPKAHLGEDFFQNKLGFVVLLNFPLTTLAERVDQGGGWSRRQWAAARLAGRFARRVPAAIQQRIAETGAAADIYIAGYNVWAHHVLGEGGERLFPRGKRLIAHWNLRDELKASYADRQKGLARQRILVKVMERIVTQTIPAVVIDNPSVDWNPSTNAVISAPKATIEEDSQRGVGGGSSGATLEEDVRYRRWLANFESARAADPHSPTAPTAIDRAFSLGADVSEAKVVGLLRSVLASPLGDRVAAKIEHRLGRELEPADLWYDGFLARGVIAEGERDAQVRRRYPSAQAFASDLPRILEVMGFASSRAKELASRIRVEPARGVGHALEAGRRGDFARLRTRVEKEGMDYKGFNIAIHELGHNVEQVVSLYDVDHTLLAGVPNTAFTEAIAFVFQRRDLEVLGFAPPSEEGRRLQVLHDFWATRELAGVALLDLAVWHWLYAHPDATPEALREAVVAAANEVWNTFFARLLGAADQPLLGVYSHLVSNPLYVFNYPVGHLISFQIEERLRAVGRVGPEIDRMARQGAVAPDLWMRRATGAPLSAQPLLRATERALEP